MSIVRVAKNSNYVVMNRTALNDERLSWKAKGIMAYLLSMPDDWVFYMDELMKHSTDGKSSFRAGFNELKDCGYVERRPIREGQRIKEWETIVHEIPIDNSLLTDFQEVEKLEVENQEVGFQEVENQPLLNTDVNQVLNKPNIDYNQILREEREGATPLLPPSSQIDESFLKIKTYFEQHIRPTTYRDAQDINKLLEFYKDADLIIEAIKIALDRGKPFINYIDGILKRWSVEQGINSYQDFLTKGGNYDATSGAQNRPNTSTFAGADEEFMRGLSKFSTK